VNSISVSPHFSHVAENGGADLQIGCPGTLAALAEIFAE